MVEVELKYNRSDYQLSTRLKRIFVKDLQCAVNELIVTLKAGKVNLEIDSSGNDVKVIYGSVLEEFERACSKEEYIEIPIADLEQSYSKSVKMYGWKIVREDNIDQQQEVVFYFDIKDPRYDRIKIDFEKLKEKNIKVEFHDPIDDTFPEISVNGYMIAGIGDINHALNELITPQLKVRD